MNIIRYSLAAAAVLGIVGLAGCGGSSTTNPTPFLFPLPTPTPTPTPAPNPTLHQFAYVATTGGIDVFTISADGQTVTRLGIDPQSTGFGGFLGLSVAPNGAFLMATDGLNNLDFFSINSTTGALTSDTSIDIGVAVSDTLNSGKTITLNGPVAIDPASGSGVAGGNDTVDNIVVGFTIQAAQGNFSINSQARAQAATTPNLNQLAIGLDNTMQNVVVAGNTATHQFDAFTLNNGVLGSDTGTTAGTGTTDVPAVAVLANGSLGVLGSDAGGGKNAETFTLTSGAVSLSGTKFAVGGGSFGLSAAALVSDSGLNLLGFADPNLINAVPGELDVVNAANANNFNSLRSIGASSVAFVIPPAAAGATHLILTAGSDGLEVFTETVSAGSFNVNNVIQLADTNGTTASTSGNVVGAVSLFF